MYNYIEQDFASIFFLLADFKAKAKCINLGPQSLRSLGLKVKVSSLYVHTALLRRIYCYKKCKYIQRAHFDL